MSVKPMRVDATWAVVTSGDSASFVWSVMNLYCAFLSRVGKLIIVSMIGMSLGMVMRRGLFLV